MVIRAAIFDMDGLLIDSEPLWQQLERQVFGELGLELTAEHCQQTTGLRIDEVARHWARRRRWSGPSPDEVARRIVSGVIDRVHTEGQAKPGAHQAIRAAAQVGFRLALASSSPRPLIDAVLERLGLEEAFEVVHSAELEPLGKPHPAVYLSTVAQLELDPTECLALEDSLNGLIAAKAARLWCLAVPEVPASQRAPFALADVLCDSLLEVDQALLRRLIETSTPL